MRWTTPPRDGGRGVEWRTRWLTVRLFSWRHGFLSYRSPQRGWFARWGAALDRGMLGVEFGRNEDDDLEISAGLWPLWLNAWMSPWPRPNGRTETPGSSDQNGSEDPQA